MNSKLSWKRIGVLALFLNVAWLAITTVIWNFWPVTVEVFGWPDLSFGQAMSVTFLVMAFSLAVYVPRWYANLKRADVSEERQLDPEAYAVMHKMLIMCEVALDVIDKPDKYKGCLAPSKGDLLGKAIAAGRAFLKTRERGDQ